MPPSRANNLSSLTAEANPAWIAPLGNGFELWQADERPFPIVRIKARSRQIIVTQPHKGPSAARLKQKFDRRLPQRDAADATPGKNDFAIGHNLDVVTFDLHSAGFRQAKDATRNGIGIDDFGLPFLYLCRIRCNLSSQLRLFGVLVCLRTYSGYLLVRGVLSVLL